MKILKFKDEILQVFTQERINHDANLSNENLIRSYSQKKIEKVT